MDSPSRGIRMTGHTHIVAGVAAAASVAAITHHPITPALLVWGGLGGLAPDLDHPEALLTRRIPGWRTLARWGQGTGWWRHRGLWHSVLLWAVTLLLIPMAGDLGAHGVWALAVGVGHPAWALALWRWWGSDGLWGWGAGYLSHMLVDTWNTSGVQWFWPIRIWVHSPIPNITVGTWPEDVVRWAILGMMVWWMPQVGLLVAVTSWVVYRGIHWL